MRGSATVALRLTDECVMGLPAGVRADKLSHSKGVGRCTGNSQEKPKAGLLEGLPGNTPFQPQEKEQPDPEECSPERPKPSE